MRKGIKLLLLMAVLVIIVAPSYAEVTSAPYHSTLKEARHAAGGRPILIDFFTDW